MKSSRIYQDSKKAGEEFFARGEGICSHAQQPRPVVASMAASGISYPFRLPCLTHFNLTSDGHFPKVKAGRWLL
jgi:hypothetical protein